MILIRSVLYFITMLVTTLTHGLAIVVLHRITPPGTSDRIATHWGKLNMRLQRIICGLRVNIVGTENLPAHSMIVMSNHQSTWETISLRGILAPHQSWVLKKELLSVPVFGRALVACRAIAIDRAAGRRSVIKVIKDGKLALDDGRLVVVFPEGTRTAPGQRQKYGIGGAVLAEKAGYPVVPIAHNAGVYWKRRGVKKYPGTIEVRVGAPIEIKGKTAAEIISEVEAWIEGELEKLPTELT